MSTPKPDEIRSFQHTVYGYFQQHQRTMPWRTKTSPYYVLVSEIMLQQTQVGRVLPKFNEFITEFPDFSHLADAPQADVLVHWQGLGYNRRARYLHQIAKQVVHEHNGDLPLVKEALVAMPGIGENTAGAILTYVANLAEIFIETNIRTCILHHFFEDQSNIADTSLVQVHREVFDYTNPRQWCWALMDYGSHLKREHANPSRQSAHHQKQTAFEGSRRQLRGRVIQLLRDGPQSVSGLHQHLKDERLNAVLMNLQAEKLIDIEGGTARLHK
jgi:A/G-specific adenine glycosylase